MPLDQGPSKAIPETLAVLGVLVTAKILTLPLTHPLRVLHTAQVADNSSLYGALTRRPIVSLYHGLTTQIIKVLATEPFRALSVYYIPPYFKDYDLPRPIKEILLPSLATSAVDSLSGTPFSRVLTLIMQSQASPLAAIRQLAHNPRSFYHGFTPSFVQATIAWSMFYASHTINKDDVDSFTHRLFKDTSSVYSIDMRRALMRTLLEAAQHIDTQEIDGLLDAIHAPHPAPPIRSSIKTPPTYSSIFYSSLVAGPLTAFVISAMETVRIHQQKTKSSDPTLATVAKLYQTGGIKAFFKGYPTHSLAQTVMNFGGRAALKFLEDAKAEVKVEEHLR
jgi:hypothetical protein